MLIISMLIIPPAAIRQRVRFPEAMVMVAALIGVVAAVPGIRGLVELDTPAEVRSTVVVLVFLFVPVLLAPLLLLLCGRLSGLVLFSHQAVRFEGLLSARKSESSALYRSDARSQACKSVESGGAPYTPINF